LFAGPHTIVIGLAISLAVTGCRNGHASSDAIEARQATPPRPPYVETREVITRLANDLMRAHGVTGLSLALIDGSDTVWATGFGFADADLQLPAGPRTVYNVGSLSKLVTVAAVLQAVERGELELDQTLAELLPELELAGEVEEQITLAQLLTHQSGLPSDWFTHGLSREPPPWTAIVTELRGLELAQAPGTLTRYSNLGMSLAGAALERASGRSYEQIVSEALLRPAGMRTAYFPGGPEPEPVLLAIHGGPRGLAAIEHAAAYREGKTRLDPAFRLAPAGGLHASVLDLATFASMILNHGRVGGVELLAPESVAAMLTAQNTDLPLDLDHRFGYGWLLDHEDLDWTGRVAWHGGRTYYHHSRLIVLPDHGLAIAVASNSITAGKVIDALAVEALLCALQEKHGLDAPIPASAVEHTPSPRARLEAFNKAHAGDYVTGVGLSTLALVRGEHDEPSEIWTSGAHGRSRLTLDSDAGGTIEALPGARVEFIDEGEHHLMVVEHQGVRRRTGVRLGPPAPIPEAWRARTGRWSVVEAAGETSSVRAPSLRIEDGRLRLEFLGLLEHPPILVVMALEVIDDRRARIQGLARGQGAIIEVRGELGDERLWWAGRELRREGAP